MALTQSFNVDAAGNEIVSGSVAVTNFPVTQPVSGSVTIAAGAAAIGSVAVSNFPVTQPVSIAGVVSTTSAAATVGTLSNIAGSAASVTLLTSNAARKGFSIFNDSTAILKVSFSATASATSFSFLLQPNAFFENSALYTGIVTGIWAAAAGSARVTELT